MYSVLLAAALTAGTAEAPAWHYSCYGCYGCCGGCYGCCGGNAFSCHGCWGCSGCYGCYGSCYGCCGGCWGCCGGCYGVYYSSCYGCCGGWGCCGGCWGCYGYGGPVIYPAYAPAVVGPVLHVDAGKAATVVVNLPADAALYVDGVKANLSSETRTFQTPGLTEGKDFYYTVKVEAVRNGETVTEEKRVVVRGGETARVTFGELTVKAPKATAKVMVKVPADAKLYVDGVLCPQTTPVRSFETPKLDAGVTYTYTLKAELVRNGKTMTDSKKIEMQAGKEVSVDFTDLTSVVAR